MTNLSQETVHAKTLRVRLPATLWTVACQAPLSMGFPRPEYWSGTPDHVIPVLSNETSAQRDAAGPPLQAWVSLPWWGAQRTPTYVWMAFSPAIFIFSSRSFQ